MPAKKKKKSAHRVPYSSLAQNENWARMIVISLGVLSLGFIIAFGGFALTQNRQHFITVPVTPTPTKNPLAIVYTGTLPCADCSGIKTTLTLFTDNTYTEVSDYIDKNTTFTQIGTWQLTHAIESKPDILVYTLTPKKAEGKEFYEVVNNKQIKLLDSNMQEITSPISYTLTQE